MNIKKVLFTISSLAVVALTSCGGSGLKHTRSKYNNVYRADLNHNGKIDANEKNLTWIQAYDQLIKEANSMKQLNEAADALNIDANEPKRTSLARYEILHEAEELAMSTGTGLPLYNYGDPYLLKPNIQGISTMNLGFKFLDKLHYTDGTSSKNFTVSVGTKAETFDPATNSDVSTTIATNQFLIGAKRYVQGEEEEGEEGKGIYKAKLVDGLCTIEKRLVTSDDVEPGDEEWINIDDCPDLTDEEPEEYEGTARYTITIKDGAVFNDGSDVTADDFIYEWTRASSGVYNGQPFGMWCNMFDMIRGYTVWNLIGQQTSSDPKDWDEDTQEKWNNTDPDKGVVLTPADKAQYAQSFEATGCAGGMAGVMKGHYDEGEWVKDNKSFTVQLINDCDYFEELLAFPAFMPVAKKNIRLPKDATEEYEYNNICKESGDWWMNKNGSYLTTGPLQINGEIDNVDSGGIKLKKAEHATPGVVGDDTVDSIEFKFIDKDSTIYDSYKSGTLQFINQFPNSIIGDLMKKPDWHSAQQIGLFYYSFNANDNTFDIRKNMSERDREKLRMAMILLVNRDDIANNVAKKGCTAANGFVSDGVMESCVPVWDPTKAEGQGAYVAETKINPETGKEEYVTKNWHERNKDISEYWDSDQYTEHYMDKRGKGGFFQTVYEDGGSEEKIMRKNTARAIELAKEAGVKYNEKTGKFTNFPRITLITNNGTGLEDIAERMQAYYSVWGIDMTIATQEWQSFLATRRIGDFAFARQGWVADYNDPRTYLDLYVSDSGNNDTQLGRDNWHNSH